MNEIADTPKPPYYAVIFTSLRTEGDKGYAETVQRIYALARQQPGFLGYEAARNASGNSLGNSSGNAPVSANGISVSYWATLEAIAAWRNHPDHRAVQARADDWYADSRIRISKVERSY